MEEKNIGSPTQCCNFCGSTQDKVAYLIAGPAANICEVCVDVCNDILLPERKLGNFAHLEIFRQGPEEWNDWRAKNEGIQPNLAGIELADQDLRGFKLHRTSLFGAKLTRVNLERSFLVECNFNYAKLEEVNLKGAHLDFSLFEGANLARSDLTACSLYEAYMPECDFQSATLKKARMFKSDLRYCDFRFADLQDADLDHCNLVGADFGSANLCRASVFGAAVWEVKLVNTIQEDLRITPPQKPLITVDNLLLAQFLYLLLEHKELRSVIDAITSKTVLILGRFSLKRKRVLDALRVALRTHNYLPVLFDFECPESRDLTETISLLAHLARFVIVDLTDAKSVPQELQAIVSALPSVPFQPILLGSAKEYGMFEHFKRYPWVLPVIRYRNQRELISKLGGGIINAAEELAFRLARRSGEPAR